MNYIIKKTSNQIKSKFYSDLEQEKIVGKFLDEKIYKEIFQNYERVFNKKEQLEGIDFKAFKNDKVFNFDEKVQLTQLGSPTPSFAFEIFYGDSKNGWLFKENKTDYYALGYFNKVKEGTTLILTGDEILEFEMVFASKKKIIKFLAEKGYTREFLEKELQELKKSIDNNILTNYEKRKTGYRKILENGINIFYTTYLQERPLNVVILRKHLNKLADRIVKYEKGKVIILK